MTHRCRFENCDREFENKTKLWSHEYHYHTKLGQKRATTLGDLFKNSLTLKPDTVISKSFKCADCPKAFVSAKALRMHRQRTHMGTIPGDPNWRRQRAQQSTHLSRVGGSMQPTAKKMSRTVRGRRRRLALSPFRQEQHHSLEALSKSDASSNSTHSINCKLHTIIIDNERELRVGEYKSGLLVVTEDSVVSYASLGDMFAAFGK